MPPPIDFTGSAGDAAAATALPPWLAPFMLFDSVLGIEARRDARKRQEALRRFLPYLIYSGGVMLAVLVLLVWVIRATSLKK